ncbi:MAG: ABC transporter substrate-binding protein [Algoriphagus sp.]|uniref:helical backbone metal receptor n=1 Tax=Algoriphagus sp. TaxID=1872435 RepID=UPI00184D3B93|nr:helical backbone metal receptor [Algoriphagus sp.]NVJ87022.1 ABC transporter substrate-binding protein [Algoriphagus sp.]
MYFTDQLNRTVFLSSPPKRIISLVPSQTELLVDLGLEDRLVGVTKFCVHPDHIRKTKKIIGGTKTYHFDRIDSLKPDLIIGNKEENEQSGIEKLAEHYRVWISDVKTLSDAITMIEEIGKLTDTQSEATKILSRLDNDFKSPSPKKGTAVYLIWNKPIMVAGKDTFIDEMLHWAGFENLILENRYPEITLSRLSDLAPEYLLLSSEPFPFKQKHVDEFRRALPNTRVKLVDGELFSWYGSRLLNSMSYFQTLF